VFLISIISPAFMASMPLPVRCLVRKYPRAVICGALRSNSKSSSSMRNGELTEPPKKEWIQARSIALGMPFGPPSREQKVWVGYCQFTLSKALGVRMGCGHIVDTFHQTKKTAKTRLT